MSLKKLPRGTAARYRSMSYIVKIDGKRFYGYLVRFKLLGIIKCFPYRKQGGIQQALLEAKKFRDSVYREHPEILKDRINRHIYQTNAKNTIGVSGVILIRRQNKRAGGGWWYYYKAGWIDPKTKRNMSKTYSVAKYGKAEAFKMACADRKTAEERIKAYYAKK